MSLQVWLPLNGSTINQGIANFQPAAADITYAEAGKIGAKCYSAGSLTMSAEQSNQVLNNREITIAFWIKPQNATTPSDIFGHANQNTGVRQFSLFQYSTDASKHGTTLHWSWTTTLEAGENYDTNGNYINTNNSSTIPDALPIGQWTHVCITYNSPVFKAYINGQLRAIRNGAVNYTFNQNTPIINASGNRHINDFRIYDHCLSPREVKLLSQGLVAHYKLDNGNPNLINNSFGNHTSSEYLIHTYSFDRTGFQRYLTAGETCTLTVCFTPAADFGYFNPHLNSGAWGGWMPNIPSDGTTNRQIVSVTSLPNWVYSNGSNHNINPEDEPARANVCMFHRKDADNAGSSGTTIHWIKLQIGDHPASTTWSPSISENPDYYNKEYDCSGYGNHGTASAILSSSADTPRYSHSTLFNDNKHIETTRNNYEGMKNTYSLVYWAKHPASSMNGKMVWGFYDSANAQYLDLYPVSGKFTLNNGGVGSNLAFNVDCPVDGQWHHYAVIGDNTKAYLYIDGQLKGQTSTLYAIPNAPLVLSGWTTKNEYRWNDGSISDFRLYATALSAAAVKELYQSSISFLDNGTLQCSEIVESPTNLKYNKNGITQAELISEVGYTNKMKIKSLSDGSAWARIHWLDVSNDTTYFTDEDEVQECIDKTNRFSLMKYVDKFKSKDNQYEFMLTYPKMSSIGYNRWTQTSSPNESTVSGLSLIGTQSWSAANNGLRQHGSACVYNCDSGDTWYAPIGQKSAWTTEKAIPAADKSTSTTETELWVRIDNLPKLTKLSMLDDAIQAFQIYEL